MSVKPSDFKDVIPSPGGSLCQKIAKAFQLPALVYDWVASMFNDDSSFTDDFKAKICALGCSGGGNPNPQNANMPSPTGVQASDGAFGDKVQVTWNGVIPAAGVAAVTKYNVYRALSTVLDPTHADLIGTTVAGVTTLDDFEVAVGTTYNYWVTATNIPDGADTSGYSGYDVGHAGTTSNTMDPVSDLRCTKAHGFGQIGLVWTPTTGATKWDIYRGTTSDPTAATKIDSDRSPKSTDTAFPDPPPAAQFWDNDGELVYYDTPPSSTVVYYYWVVGKKDSPPATSPKSNSDTGWDLLSTVNGAAPLVRAGDPVVVPGGTVHLVLRGGGGAGAGGGSIYGGGGGGGGAVVYADHVGAANSAYRLILVPDAASTGNAAASTNGSNGPVTKIQYSADGLFDDTVDLLVSSAAGGGVYNASGTGAGGAASTGTSPGAGLTNVAIIAGKAGGAASGVKGGKSGYAFGARRLAGAHYNGFSLSSWSGTGTAASGSFGTNDPTIVPLATGGAATPGSGWIYY